MNIHNRRLTSHRDGFLDGSHVKFRIDRGSEAGWKFNRVALDAGKSSYRECHGVNPRPQVHDGVAALAVGDRGPHFFDKRGTRRFDRYAWQHPSRGIGDKTGEGTLRPCHRRTERKQESPKCDDGPNESESHWTSFVFDVPANQSNRQWSS